MTEHERRPRAEGAHAEKERDEHLPQELLWAAGGHASDVVLTALADGQVAVVPPGVRMHVERCPACMTHLGHAALLSLHAGQQLALRADHDHVLAAASARRPLPRVAIAVGLGVAFLGLVPSIVDGGASGAAIGAFVTHAAPVFIKHGSALVRQVNGSPAGLALTYGTAALLVCMGLAVVRLLPKKEVSR